MGSPTGHSNHGAFLNSLESITEKLPIQMTRHTTILPTVVYSFYTWVGWGNAWKEPFPRTQCQPGTIRPRTRAQGLNVNLSQPGLEPLIFWSRSQVSTPRPQCHPKNHCLADIVKKNIVAGVVLHHELRCYIYFFIPHMLGLYHS